MKANRIATIGVLTALIVVGRMSFTFLPNVQPMTTILILITLTIGLGNGLLVALLSILISNLSLGMGVWTIAQLVSFSVIIIITSLFHNFYDKIPPLLMALHCGLMGLLYGLIISLVQAPFFGWASFMPYYFSGIPYDFLHAFGNVCFYIILYKPLSNILKK